MNFEFTHGSVFQPPVFLDTYELIVEYMHGDADGDTYKTARYKGSDEEGLKRDLEGLIKLISASRNGRIPAGEIEVEGWTQEQRDHFSDEFYEGDITCEGEPASCVGFKIWYWDNNGLKYPVSLKVDGKPYR